MRNLKYTSTRSKDVKVTAAMAISMGIAEDGGLFVPESIPALNEADFKELCELDYVGRAKKILGLYLDDFTSEELDYCTKGAYLNNFENNLPAPLYKLADGKYILELWHGPTCAFKDLALQILPYLLTVSAKKVNKGKTVILVATSGDTGKAALEGFKDVENTDIIVFYPNNGVSPMQKLQMDTQSGSNVFVSAIDGNFDDAQTGVKKIFTNSEIKAKLKSAGYEFSSANSINWGRLVPQIVYYVSAYCDLLKNGTELKDGFNVAVPTGNFGNILAAYYAKQMGVPINKLICASNKNNILTDFIKTGVYDRNRSFYTTISPSMDILVSSNLERMLYLLSGGNAEKISELQNSLSKDGVYKIDGEMLEKLQAVYSCGCCDDDMTLETIKNVNDTYNYLCDTHTAVAVKVCEEYIKNEKDERPVVIASTASPYKFSASVLKGLDETKCSDDEFGMVNALSELTGVKIPEPISALKDSKPRFNNVCKKDEMDKLVLNYLDIE